MQALLDGGDALHAQAKAIEIASYRTVVTSEFVFVELLAAFCKGEHSRKTVSAYIEFLRTQPQVKIVPASAELFEEAFQLYGMRLDKTASLVDCTSFIIMTNNGIREALTQDDDFRQAGFNPLLK